MNILRMIYAGWQNKQREKKTKKKKEKKKSITTLVFNPMHKKKLD